MELQKRDVKGPLRIPIIDKMKENYPVIHGKVENGTINIGDKLALMPRGEMAQVLELKDGKGQMVKYACAGENVQVKINIADEESVKRGDVLCLRDNMCPVTEIFEAEVDVLELLDYKPILSRGSTCMMHIHTYHDEVEIKDIIKAVETNEKGEQVTKNKPQYTRSHAKITCRIVPKTPVCLEKFE